MSKVNRTGMISKVFVTLVCVGLGAGEFAAKADDAAATPQAKPEITAVSCTAAANLVGTHAFLTAILDGYDRGAFTAAQAELFAQQAVDSAQAMVKGLESLLNIPDDQINKTTLREMIRSFNLLAESAKALIRFAQTGNAGDRATVVMNRDSAWTVYVTALNVPHLKPQV